MLFDKVKREHILKGIKDFEEKGYPNGFGPSSTYDVIFEDKRYPPKAIMAYANYYAEGRTIERYFKGGEGTDCFKAFERNGFEIRYKSISIDIGESNVKKKFIKWLLKNPRNNYYDNDKEKLEEQLDKYNSFFELDIYNGSNLKSIKKYLENELYAKATSPFLEFSERVSRHLPRAILGKKNYFQFIDEKLSNTSKHNMEFYKEEEFRFLKEYSGVDYLKDNETHKEVFNTLKKAFEKTKYWADTIKDESFNDGVVKILRNPINQAQKFEHYNWAKIYPTQKDLNDKWLAITLGISDLMFFIKIDTVGLSDSDPLRINYFDYRGDINNSKIVFQYRMENVNSWDELFELTKKDMAKLMLHFAEIKKLNTENKSEFKSNVKMMNSTTNQILYGPPGTGKTYFLKDKLFEKYISKETSITKEQHFETVVSGCSWWQVIAIALLDLGNAKVSDIFDHDWVKKKASLSNSKTIRPTLWGQLQSHTINECEYVNVSSRQQPLIFNKTEDSRWEILEDQVEELTPELYDLKDSVTNYNPDPDKIIKHYDFVTFHQSFAYEDFIEGIKPILPQDETEETKDLGYKIEDGVFKKLCQRAQNDPDHRYAIFIDEINRGNVSAIFGELITLIEIDKRQGAKNELSIKLPYSKKEFYVPSNLDIYGTMNTADRSVEALDTALRRRFEFKEMMPDYSVLKDEVVDEILLSDVLKTINQRIELLIDRDHTIGHSYFVNVDTEKKLANAFNNKIVPLLQEYFYGDYGKIGLVLGQGFVEKMKNESITFAKFEYENSNDFKTPTFVLKRVDENSVKEAVQLLLGDLNNKEE